MDYNPFIVELRAEDDAITEMEARRDALAEQVSRAAAFDPSDEAEKLGRLRAHLEEQTTQLATLESQLLERTSELRDLDSKTADLERDARVDFRIVVRWLNDEHDRAKGRLTKHRQRLAALRALIEATDAKRDEATNEVAEIANTIDAASEAIAWFGEFSPTEAVEEIALINAELSERTARRDHLRQRTEDVEGAVAGPLAEFHRLETEIRTNAVALGRLKSEVADIEEQITKVEKLKKKLSEATSPTERWELHDKCERKYGDGSPSSVLSELRGKRRPLMEDIRGHERQVNRLLRDKQKTERRIRELAVIAAREISALVIDGNNCCYDGNDFIGLAALIPMTEVLDREYRVTVVFDAGIRGQLRANDNHIRAALPYAKVHVGATKTKADATILDISNDPGTWVISNDRFGEFGDKDAVAESRIIRHEIVAGRVLVHDLGVDEPLAEQHRGST